MRYRQLVSQEPKAERFMASGRLPQTQCRRIKERLAGLQCTISYLATSSGRADQRPGFRPCSVRGDLWR